MRTIFCSNGGLLGDAVLRHLLEDSLIQPVGVVHSRRVYSRNCGFLSGAANFFWRCGPVYPVFLWSITTMAETVGWVTGTGSICRRARVAGLPVLGTRDVNSDEGLRFIRRLRPDLMVSAHFDQRFHPPLCHGQLCRVVNIHPSLLPLDKGLEPALHVLAASRKLGVTLHEVSEDLDGGKALSRQRVGHHPRSLLEANLLLYHTGAELVRRWVKDPSQEVGGREVSEPGTYHSWPSAAEVRMFRKSGGRLLVFPDLRKFL